MNHGWLNEGSGEIIPFGGWGGIVQLIGPKMYDRIAAHAHIFFANEQREPSR